MRKNDLIKKLQAIEGNPSVVLWNGFVQDYQEIGNIIEDTLTKPSFDHYAKTCELEFCRDMDDPDTLYPNGTAWEIHRSDLRSYKHITEVSNEKQWCYEFHCVETAGRCGMFVSGDSKQEAVDKWNRCV